MSTESVWSVSDDEDSVGSRALHLVEMSENCPTKITSASNGQKSIANVEGIVTPKCSRRISVRSKLWVASERSTADAKLRIEPRILREYRQWIYPRKNKKHQNR